MSLRIRRGTDAQRAGVVFDLGELVVTTDEFKLFVGDGVTAGGRNVAQNLAGQGLSYNATTGKLDSVSVSLTTDDVTEGSNNKYFSNELAQDAVGAALTAGNLYNTGIQFTYDDFNNRITAEVQMDGVGITAVEDDVAPALGGNLSLNSHDITGTGNIDIIGSVTASFVLANDLNLNSFDLTGTGNVDITGTITASGGYTGTATITDLIAYGSPSGDIASSHNGITDGPNGTWLDINVAKNTWNNPVELVAEDNAGGIRTNVYVDGVYKIASAFDTYLTADADPLASYPASKLILGVGNNSSVTFFEFKPEGTLVAPVIQTGVYSTSPDDLRPATPAKGMIIFNDTTSQFEGWNGAAWVTLG